MKALVVSDTHGNLSLFQQAIDQATSDYDVDFIWHLGDNFEDSLNVNRGRCGIYRVPGIYHPVYRSGMVDPMLSITEEGISTLLVHDVSEVSQEMKIHHELICFGHSHCAELKLDHGNIYLNPGHLKCAVDRGYDASFAIVSLSQMELEINIHRLDGSIHSGATYDIVQGRIIEHSVL